MNGKLFKIKTVADSAKGKQYVRDILGNTYFPQNTDMELTAGHYAYAIESVQTKTRDAETGELIDLTSPRTIMQITGTWATKAEAIADAAEAGTLAMEVAAEVAKVGKDLNLSDAAVAQLSAAW